MRDLQLRFITPLVEKVISALDNNSMMIIKNQPSSNKIWTKEVINKTNHLKEDQRIKTISSKRQVIFLETVINMMVVPNMVNLIKLSEDRKSNKIDLDHNKITMTIIQVPLNMERNNHSNKTNIINKLQTTNSSVKELDLEITVDLQLKSHLWNYMLLLVEKVVSNCFDDPKRMVITLWLIIINLIKLLF